MEKVFDEILSGVRNAPRMPDDFLLHYLSFFQIVVLFLTPIFERMLKVILILMFTFSMGHSTFSQSSLDTNAIKKQLVFIYDRDQKTRASGDSIAFIDYLDSCNLAQVEKLVADYGWLGKTTIGPMGNYTLFLVIQHTDLATQEKYFPLLQESVKMGESRPADLAFLQDRILMRQGKKQIYGSQVIFNKETGVPEFYPIEDEKNVNVRRTKIGLDPLEEYASHFGIDYKLPTE